jgi:hypothetical protein
MGSQLDIDAHILQLCDRIPQCSLIGGVGRLNARTLLMQEAGSRNPGATKTNNHDFFTGKIHHCPSPRIT